MVKKPEPSQVRKELVEAAAAGMREFISTTRGAQLCGAGCVVHIVDNGHNIMVAVSDHNGGKFDVHFTTMEI